MMPCQLLSPVKEPVILRSASTLAFLSEVNEVVLSLTSCPALKPPLSAVLPPFRVISLFARTCVFLSNWLSFCAVRVTSFALRLLPCHTCWLADAANVALPLTLPCASTPAAIWLFVPCNKPLLFRLLLPVLASVAFCSRNSPWLFSEISLPALWVPPSCIFWAFAVSEPALIVLFSVSLPLASM